MNQPSRTRPSHTPSARRWKRPSHTSVAHRGLSVTLVGRQGFARNHDRVEHETHCPTGTVLAKLSVHSNAVAGAVNCRQLYSVSADLASHPGRTINLGVVIHRQFRRLQVKRTRGRRTTRRLARRERETVDSDKPDGKDGKEKKTET